MIKTICIIFFSSVTIVVSSQESKIVKPVNDIRHLGIHEADTATVGYQLNDIFANRILCLNSRKRFADDENAKNEKDTVSGYEIHFLKLLRDKLHNYTSTVLSSEDYDKMSYLWTSDTTVTVELINSVKEKTKSISYKKVHGWPLWMVY